jgi:hypothetical protein
MKRSENQIKNNKGNTTMVQNELHIHLHIYDSDKKKSDENSKGLIQRIVIWGRILLSYLPL